MQPREEPRRLSALTTTLLVVASMIGTGVFTTTGFLLRDIGSTSAVLVAWLLGGALAFFGALGYAELAAALPSNGGEYALVSRIYHPALGFACGFVSLVVGFAAPIAASAIAFGDYVHAIFPAVPALPSALGLVIALSLLHAIHVGAGAKVQDVMTIVKIALVALFALAGLFTADLSRLNAPSAVPLGDAVFSPGFAVGLVFVSFAYSGWNAAAYVAGEVERPSRTLPLALFAGTLLVTVLYVALNLVFVASAPIEDLAGQVAIGDVAARRLFGQGAGDLMSGIIAAGLLSTVGALILTGARIAESMGRDYERLRFLAIRHPKGGPMVAVAVQSALAILMLLTSSFEALLAYIGFTLAIFAALTVAGVFVMRYREPTLHRPVRALGHPFTSLAFIATMVWMMIATVREKPIVTWFGAATIAAGLAGYLVVRSGQSRARK